MIDLDKVTGCPHKWNPTRMVKVDCGKGGVQFRELCDWCGKHNWVSIGHAEVRRRGINPDTLVTFRNRDCQCRVGCPACSHPCQECGTFEMTQLHHTWQVAIFGLEVAERHPKQWLCQLHHAWHHQEVLAWHRRQRESTAA